jgi:hypothetical protein
LEVSIENAIFGYEDITQPPTWQMEENNPLQH